MKVKLITLSILLLNLTAAFAEEHEAAHHEPTIWDLKYPTLNFVILVGFIIWKLKKPLSEMFDKKADDVKSLMDSAEKQSKDANQKLQDLEGKIKNIDSELVKINGDWQKMIELRKKFVESGIFLRPFANCIYIMPALNITKVNLKDIIHTINKILIS